MRLIDADALINYVKSLGTSPLNEWETWGVLAAIEKQPPIDAVPVVHGMWDSKGLKIRCSGCTYRVYLGTYDEGIHREEKALFRYCPNCGAKMELEESL